MARIRSPEKRGAIFQAAVQEIAEAGLGAPTARIAQRADVASGTLFNYFATKEELLNQLYLELKGEVYVRLNAGFPHKASLEKRARHIWSSFLDWAMEFPEKRKVSILLNMSDLVTAETRARTAAERALIETTLNEVQSRRSMRGFPPGFAAATMSAMQEATIEFAAKGPEKRREIVERAFGIFWRAVK